MRYLATHLLRSNWKGRTFGAREFTRWRKTLTEILAHHVMRVFEQLKRDGIVRPIDGHGMTRVYEWKESSTALRGK